MPIKNVTAPAIRFLQNDRVFYAVTLPAGVLIDLCRVDEWDADREGADPGYQRAPSRQRLLGVSDYVERVDAIFPEGGFLNARPEHSEEESSYGQILKFESDSGDDPVVQVGKLTIPDSVRPLFIVDMQHRLGGLQIAIEEHHRPDLYDFPILVTISDGLSKLEEVEQFEMINTRQKKVRTDLARRLLSIQMQDSDRKRQLDEQGRLWEARGPVIAHWLNTHKGIWQGRIMPPNETKKDRPTAIVRETSFVTSLKPILQTPYFTMVLDEEAAADTIAKYWAAVERVFPKAFMYPEDHVIQKTPGVFSLHSIAPYVIEMVRSKNQDLTSDNMLKVLEPLGEIGGDYYWNKENSMDGAAAYGSMKGFKVLAIELKSYLQQI
ncbi:DGQHR domain-containing protein [Candidatus Zixiibacteriota bacterium]